MQSLCFAIQKKMIFVSSRASEIQFISRVERVSAHRSMRKRCCQIAEQQHCAYAQVYLPCTVVRDMPFDEMHTQNEAASSKRNIYVIRVVRVY